MTRSVIVLATGCLVLLGALVYVGRWLTFSGLMNGHSSSPRQDPSVESLLSRHVDHPSLVPVLIYQALFASQG